MKRHLRRARSFGLYVLAPLLAAVAPLLVIPATTARYGAAGWSSIAIGLSSGLVAAVIGELGWSIVGPQQVARRPQDASDVYDRALAARVIVVVPLAALSAALAVVLAPHHALAAGLVAAGVTLGALSPAWYFTGLNRPHLTLATESLPRVVLVGGAAVGIACGGALELYGIALIVGGILPLALATSIARVRCVPSAAAVRAVPTTLRAQWALVAGRGATTMYRALPTPILAVIAPDLVALYAALDRPLRLGLQFLTAVPQRLQAWVAVEDDTVRVRRTRRALVANVVSGVAAGGVFASAMPLVAPVLYSGTVDVTAALSVPGGVLVAVICASRGFGLALVADGRAGVTVVAALAAAAIGLPAIVFGAIGAGAAGVIAALVLAEFVGIVVQWAKLTPRSRPRDLQEVSA
ncbi:MAG: hypothetical protein V4755_06805 [Curtobacterium sp.]